MEMEGEKKVLDSLDSLDVSPIIRLLFQTQGRK